MRTKPFLTVLMFSAVFLATFAICVTPTSHASEASTTWWDVQSIDTVKSSRDFSREQAKNVEYDTEIDLQIKNIAATGATHVAIGTPYDEEFLPMLKRWVSTARKYNLNVWFRGNFSGWEKWFDYEQINREEHLKMTRKFILNNGDLFQDKDIFTACPECENGGPGDPRHNGDLVGHRAFLIEEYKLTTDSFRKIGKSVKSNYNPMNGDVALLIMDEETTRQLGGVVVIDHYVNNPQQLAKDIKSIATKSGGKVVLGEFGAPIPDIHGQMTSDQQAAWLKETLAELVKLESLIGVNYWVNTGGSSRIWSSDGTPLPAVGILTHYFQPKVLNFKVINDIGRPVGFVKVLLEGREYYSNEDGELKVAYFGDSSKLNITAKGYKEVIFLSEFITENGTVNMEKTDPGLFYRLVVFVHNLLLRGS